MRKFSNILAVLTVISLGMFIGYANAPNNTVQATTITGVRWVDVPRENCFNPYGIVNIDLQNEEVSISGNTENTTVNIQKEIKKVPVYVEKKVEVPVYKHDLVWGTKVFKALAPLTLPKINVDRN